MDEDGITEEPSGYVAQIPIPYPLSPILDNSEHLTIPPVADDGVYSTDEVIEVITSPPVKIRKRHEASKKDANKTFEETDDCCSICFERFTHSGDHKIASLKCGHLFGHKCIVQWLKMPDSRACPACKASAHRRDIRLIYAKNLVAADNSELEAMTVKYDEERSRCLKLELELSKCKLVHNTLTHEIVELKELNAELRRRLGENGQSDEHVNAVTWRIALEKNIEVSTDGSCRVITHDTNRRLVYITKHTQNALFPGFGVKKLNYETFTSGPCLQLHPKAIRDMAYSKQQDFLLTASLDKTAKLVSMDHNRVALTFSCEMPLWSCAWDNDSFDRFFVGGPGGVVLQYDVRQPRTCLHRLTQPSDVSPVVSLASTPYGILTCHLNSCWLKKQFGSSFRDFCMSTDGPFVSLTYDANTDRFLLSSRPSQQCCFSRHRVCKFEFGAVSCTSAVDTMLEGSSVQTLMSRSCQLFVGSDSLVAAYSERDSAVIIYSVERKQQLQSLPSQDHVMDMTPIVTDTHKLLATLSGNRVRIYKAIPYNP